MITLHAAGEQVILGAAELGRTRRGAVLLNSARGGLVDEEALLDAMRDEHFSGVWFDAFWEEPYTGPLLEQERFFATPHVGTYTDACRSTMESQAATNLARSLGLISAGEA